MLSTGYAAFQVLQNEYSDPKSLMTNLDFIEIFVGELKQWAQFPSKFFTSFNMIHFS